MDRALWFAGSGQRMKRFLSKASHGNGFTVAVVGGSGQSSLPLHPSAQIAIQTSYCPSSSGDFRTVMFAVLAQKCRWGGRLIARIVSAGHGLGFNGGWDEPETPLNMNRRIFDHLNTMFPAPGGAVIGEAGGNGKNGFVNRAQGGMGTSLLRRMSILDTSADGDRYIILCVMLWGTYTG